jgi:hypothetical protein
VSHPHDDTAPVEHDPTGMRALLSGLPEPEPMPDDLVARISAALAAEARRGDGIEQFWSPVADESGASPTRDADGEVGDAGARVVPMRRRRFGMRHLGVAAAAVTVLGLGGYVLGSLDEGVVASLTAGSSGDSAAAGAADSAKSERAPFVAPEAGSGEVVVVMSGVDHSSDRLQVTARELDDGTLDPIADLSAESPALGPIATAIGARSCADALGIPADAGILVDVSEVDGTSGAVLVVHSDAGRAAWAVDRSCTTGHTGLIRGPVPLD